MYLNWDIAADREAILRSELPPGPLWIFDEIHKYRGWRNWLKVTYDGRPNGQQILVTGSARLENLVAAHLLKWVHWVQDTEGRDLDLRYFRDTDGREVDFVVVEKRTPILLVECKWSDDELDRGLRYLSERFPAAAAWQVSATGTKDYRTPDRIRVAPAVTFLRTLV